MLSQDTSDKVPLQTILDELDSLYASANYIPYSNLHDLSEYFLQNHATFTNFYQNPYRFFKERRYRKLIRIRCSETSRQAHNGQYIAQAQSRVFEIEGRLLDKQQIEAVVANEDAQLVMAAAGSGKTLSLLAKVHFLVNTLHVKPEKILTISFTNASAHELSERLSRLGLAVDGKTFHALGRAILVGQNTHTIDQTEQQRLIKSLIDSMLRNNESFTRHYNDYILHYFSMPTPLLEIKTLEELVRHNRSFQTHTLKPVTLDKAQYDTTKQTSHGEKVRSKEEQIIANFLYINSVEYEYEKPFPGYSSYHPDFTITTFSEPVYLEHQGIDRNNKTRPDIDSKKYVEKMKWNEDYHRKGGTRLIETFSYEFQEGTILNNLEKNLRKHGVEIVRRQESEISKLIQNTYGNEVVEFTKLIITFMGLLKTSEYTLTEVYQKVSLLKSPYQRLRIEKFLALFTTLYEAYEAHLSTQNAIDFSDMIVKAADTLASLPTESMQYEYILVDEVQDLSGARYRLLKALLDRSPSSKLFAVGDDWQSIFRFAGSDLTLLQDFEARFDRFTRHSVIEQTHRFNNPLLDQSSQFIKKNPVQIQKKPFSSVPLQTLLRVNNSATRESDATALDDELRALVDSIGIDGIKKQTIFIIGRYKRDLQRLLTFTDARMQFQIVNETGDRVVWTDTRTGFSMEIPFMTMHSSKGLTCDYTFILNGNGGPLGIPATREDDPIIHLLLAHEDTFPVGEERRLFYVALTRAKLATTIICTTHNPSPFVDELKITPHNKLFESEAQVRCPDCHSGYIIKRTGPYGAFYGCTNFGYGCRYITKQLDILN